MKVGDRVKVFMPYGTAIGRIVAIDGSRAWVQEDGDGPDYVWVLSDMELVAR